MKKICYSERSRNETGQYLENQQRKEKPAMAQKVMFLMILATLPILGFVCRKPAQLPPSVQNTSGPEVSVPANWKEYRNTQAGYSVQIPEDWNTRDIRGNGTLIGINQGPVPTRAVIDTIRVELKPNPKRLSVEDFYRQPSEVQLFEDAKGGVELAKVNGRDALRFKDVIGLVNYEIVVIPLGTRIIELQLSQPVSDQTVFGRLLETMEVE